MSLKHLYENRFPEAERRKKAAIWRVLVRAVFSRWIEPESTVVDLGAGYCEFINAVEARRRIAIDLNPDTAASAAPGVEVHAAPVERLSFIADEEVDVVFTSNFFEHLPTKALLTATVEEALRVLKPGGRLIAMGPNVRLVPGAYWDYFDHVLPLSERSLAELLDLCGFELERVEARFLPYTTKSAIPQWPWLVRLYLAARPLSSFLMGKQFLVIARKPATAGQRSDSRSVCGAS